MQNIKENDPLVTRTEARAMLGGIARGTLQRWEKEGRLPAPIRLSTRVIGWRRSTIESALKGGLCGGQ